MRVPRCVWTYSVKSRRLLLMLFYWASIACDLRLHNTINGHGHARMTFIDNPDSTRLSDSYFIPENDAIRSALATLDQYMTSGDSDTLYLDLAVHKLEEALRRQPFRVFILKRLSRLLLARFNRFGRMDDLDESIVLLRRALKVLPGETLSSHDLGLALLRRFQLLDELEDLEGAITAQYRAVELTPHGHPDKRAWMSDLGATFQHRFVRVGELADLEAAISMQRDAIELMPDSDPVKPMCMSNLGAALLRRFERVGELADIEAAVSAGRDAVELTPDGHPDKAARLSNLGKSLQKRFERVDEPADLEAAISAHRDAIELTPNGHPDKPGWMNSLGDALQCRFERLDELADLNAAISVHRDVVELKPNGHPDKPGLMSNLGLALRRRFQRLGDVKDIDTAISMHRDAVELIPDGHPTKPVCFCNLGCALQRRFERIGELADLEAAISALRDAVKRTPNGHPNKLEWMSDLGIALLARFERVGELHDIESAISLHRDTVKLAPDGHSDKLARMLNLGNALLRRFERVGELGDLEAAITALRNGGTELTSHGRRDKPIDEKANLGLALQRRFEHIGELEDLEAAISLHRDTIELTPDDHPNKPALLSNLGNALCLRFDRVGELEDLETAKAVQRAAVELTPNGHPDKPVWMNNLGITLQRRFERVGELVDLEAAVSAHRDAIELTPDGHPDKPKWMDNLGNSLVRRFQRVGDFGDLEAAISVHRDAIELTPDGHPDKPVWINNIGNDLLRRFQRVGELGDLEATVLAQRSVIQLTPDGHPNKASWLINLGMALWLYFEQDLSQLQYFSEACDCFVNGIAQLSSSPSDRFLSARYHVRILTKHNNLFATSPQLLLQAHSDVLRLLPELIWLGSRINQRYEESSKASESVSEAVSVAIAHGVLAQAVEWLEAGRSLIWSQILALRTPLDQLDAHHPELSKSLHAVRQQLQHSDYISRSVETSVDSDEGVLNMVRSTSHKAIDRHRDLSLQYGRLLSQIRSLAGFEDFLRPKRFSALLPSPELIHGYFVFINVYRTHCDALILMPSGLITTLALPKLSPMLAQQLQSLWIQKLKSRGIRERGSRPLKTAETHITRPLSTSDSMELRHSSRMGDDALTSDYLLEHIWNWIVGPILDALELPPTTQNESQPHITWCPTGPLARLPLHAAGVYSEPDGPRVFNYAVSSYAPSLSALVRSSEGLAEQRRFNPSVLVVTQPATPGQPPLPGTVDEARRLHDILHESHMQYDMLENKQATLAAVRTVMDRHSWVHFACHGSQHKSDATKSAFHLYDGPLSLSELMQTTADNAELAFLSACQTATGDEKNPEEAVHLAAGMLAVGFKGVVATMWSIGDKEAPLVVDAYYKKLLELRSGGKVGKRQTGAAYALHEAVKVLRDHVGEKDFVSWAPFVHFGA